jgi:hypothetical protein
VPRNAEVSLKNWFRQIGGDHNAAGCFSTEPMDRSIVAGNPDQDGLFLASIRHSRIRVGTDHAAVRSKYAVSEFRGIS